MFSQKGENNLTKCPNKSKTLKHFLLVSPKKFKGIKSIYFIKQLVALNFVRIIKKILEIY